MYHAWNKQRKITRRHPIPAVASVPISIMGRATELQAHPDYKAAKAGNSNAAAQLVKDLVSSADIKRTKEQLPPGAIFVALHAQEAAGKNKLPIMLAQCYASEIEGEVDTEIVQINKTFHTGSKAMERMVARPEFDGPVEPGQNYVLVDDVVTLGGTLAEAGNYTIDKGGNIVGIIVLANSSRTSTLRPTKIQVRLLEERYGQIIRELFSVEPVALTAAEAIYLIGFKSADALRNRAAKARQENGRRRGPKSLPT